MFKSKLYFVLLLALFCFACAFNAQSGQAESSENQKSEIEQPAAENQTGSTASAVGSAGQQSAGIRFKGSIAQNRFEMTLRRDKNRVEGSYYYLKSGSANPLKLTGNIDESGRFTLQEFDSSGKQTGEFSGVWKNEPNEPGATLEGEWRKTKASEGTAFWADEQMIALSGTAQINTKTISETNKPKRFEINAEYPELVNVPNAAPFNNLAKKQALDPIANFKKDMLAQSAEDLKYLPEG